MTVPDISRAVSIRSLPLSPQVKGNSDIAPPANHKQVEIGLLLGSNIQPEHFLPLAVSKLRNTLTVLEVSKVWETQAVGTDGPSFLNAAIRAHTSLDPQSLKREVLRPLETSLGRIRTDDKYAPRTIDIDLVTWNSIPMDDDLWRYAHAAVPVAELLPLTKSSTHNENLVQASDRLLRKTSMHYRPDVILA